MTIFLAPLAITGNASSAVLSGRTGLSTGDQRLALLTLTSGPTLNTASLTNGWSLLYDWDIAPDTTRHAYLLQQNITASVDPTTNVTLTFTATSNYILSQTGARGFDAVTAFDVTPSRTTANTGASMAAPEVTPTVVGVRLLIWWCKLGTSSGLTITPPATMQTLARTVGNGSAGQCSRLCTELLESTSTTTGHTATSGDSATRWVAVTVALRPAVVPPNFLWLGDGETQDFSQFADTSEANGGIDYMSPQVRSVVAAPSGSGSAFQFAVNGVASNTTQRCESRFIFGDIDEGDDLWFAGSTYLPSGFPTSPGSWQLIMQMKNDASGTPPLELCVENGQFQLQGGAGHPSGSNPMPAQNLGSASTQVIDAWVFHILFSSDPVVGKIWIWRNGNQVVNGYQPPGGTKYPSQVSYPKIGIYRDPALSTTGATVIHDGWKVGTTRQAVDPNYASPTKSLFFSSF